MMGSSEDNGATTPQNSPMWRSKLPAAKAVVDPSSPCHLIPSASGIASKKQQQPEETLPSLLCFVQSFPYSPNSF
jgi:hypothetical protein